MAWEIPELALYRHPRLILGLRALRRRVHRRIGPLRVTLATSPEPVAFAERGRLRPRPAGRGTLWGTAFTCAWFHVTGEIPAEYRDAHVAAILDIDGEAMVLDASGRAVGAVSSRTTPVEEQGSSRGKTRLDLTPELCPNGRIDLWLDAGFNGKLMAPFGVAQVKRLDLVVVDDEAEALYLDALALAYAVVAATDEQQAAASRASFDDAVRRVRAGDIAGARAALAAVLQGRPDPRLELTAIGHGHLDLAWLWPLRETRRKARRTLTHQLDLIDRYPEHVYGVSQPQQLAWLEADDPELFDRVVAAMKAGRIEAQGGMWVEADANLPSGESLVRQSLYGQRCWQRLLGRTVDVCWLPDVFGYNGNLPQLLAKAGMTRFMTIKLSWNEHNDFGHRSFVWRGIDGSEVLVHMPPEGNYVSSGTAIATARARDLNPELDAAPEALLVYGSGDGGGGPGPVHLEMLRRSASIEGFPAVVRTGTSASFFDRLDAYREALPAHSGELYLEKHQGTYTTQGRIKRWNRLLEHRLHDVEYLAALAALDGRPWPRALLDSVWKDVLLHQFHDIIPGSSIERVNVEAEARYAALDAALRAEQEALLGASGDEVFVNTTTVRRQGHIRGVDGWASYDAAPFETVALAPWSGTAPTASAKALENDLLRATFDDAGALVSLIDKTTGRESLAAASNHLVIYQDKWTYFDAWDIDIDYRKRPSEVLKPSSVEVFVDGPRAVRRSRYRHGTSVITQDAVLTTGSPCLRFETHADWHETWRMLRAEFVPKTWADEVTCDIQYGHLARSTRDETPQERAQFEICAHQFVDISDADGGLALLNDGKYGHRVKDGVISLALLRSPVYPDRTADRGVHEFTYALYPHAGSMVDSDVQALAADLNAPVLVGRGTPRPPAFEVLGQGVWLDVVKAPEDSDGLVLRLHEVRGQAATVSVRTPLAKCGERAGSLAARVPEPEDRFRVIETDLLERPVEGGATSLQDLTFGPFEIRTFVLTPTRA